MDIIKSFYGIVAPIYKIVLIVAAALIPLIIIRILVSRSTTNAEELRESRELTKAGLNLILIFILFPSIAGILITAISAVFTKNIGGIASGQSISLVNLQGTGASSLYSIIFVVITWISIAFASLARTTFTYSLVPSIGLMEETTFFNASSQGGVGNAINSFWIFFMGLAVAVIMILVLVDYFKDIFAMASGENGYRQALGGGIFTILARVITSILMAAFSWPISRAIIFMGEQLYNIFVRILGPNPVYGTVDCGGGMPLIGSDQGQTDLVEKFVNNNHQIAAGTAVYALTPWSAKMQSVISGGGSAAPGKSGISKSVILSIASLPQALIILFVSTYSTMMVVTITALMAMRFIMLAFLVIISPVVFSGLASKFTEKGFSKWLNKIITWSVFPVITAMILLFGYYLANGISGAFIASTTLTGLNAGAGIAADKAVYFVQMFIYASAMMMVSKAPSLISELTSGLTEGMEEPNAMIASITKRR
jgi:hypothetical protein